MSKIEKLNSTLTAIITGQKADSKEILEACVDIALPLGELFSPNPVSKEYLYLTNKTQVERCRYIIGEIKKYANKTNDLQLVTSIENSIHTLKSTNPEIYKTWMVALGKPIYMRKGRKDNKT
jgi:hypothetical protein